MTPPPVFSPYQPVKKRPVVQLALMIMVGLAGFLSALVIVLWRIKVFNLLPQLQQGQKAVQEFLNLPSLQGPDTVILLMGVDHNRAGGMSHRGTPATDDERQKALFAGARTDTMLLARFSPANRSISMVSLPRDSKVFYDNGMQVGKLNGAFALGGLDKAKEVVEASFGVPVDHVAVVHLEAVRTLVDTLGGIEMTLPKALRYTDNADGLRIRLPQGTHKLNGEEVVGYLRFRHDALADIGRIRRQHYFLTAVKARLAQPATLLKVPELLMRLRPYLLTDMNDGQLVALANMARSVQPSGLRVATLPGHASSSETTSYWIVEPYAAKQVLNRLIFNTASTEATLRGQEPLQLGILYAPQAEAWVESLAEAMASSAHFNLNCRKPLLRPSHSMLIEQSLKVRDEDTPALAKLAPVVTQLPVVVAPHNTTYEQLGCKPSDDITLVISDDSLNQLSAVPPQGNTVAEATNADDQRTVQVSFKPR